MSLYFIGWIVPVSVPQFLNYVREQSLSTQGSMKRDV